MEGQEDCIDLCLVMRRKSINDWKRVELREPFHSWSMEGELRFSFIVSGVPHQV
jgi:hypothetical protein